MSTVKLQVACYQNNYSKQSSEDAQDRTSFRRMIELVGIVKLSKRNDIKRIVIFMAWQLLQLNLNRIFREINSLSV